MENKGVSAILGVILMVCIVVAIAAIVYVYVEGLRTEQDEPELTVEGTVTSVVNAGPDTTWNATVYNITLDNENTHQMLFRTEDAVVPPTQVELRFYYNLVIKNVNENYYDVYKIKSL